MAVRPLSRKFRRMSGPAFSAKNQPIEPDSELEANSLPEPPAPARPHRPFDLGQALGPAEILHFPAGDFPRLLGHVSPDARPGDFVNVYDKNGNLTGGGLFNPRAKIPLRVVCHSTTPIDESYFEIAIRRAVALRRELFKLDETTDAYRLIGSDGDGLSGLMIDRYGDTLLAKFTRSGSPSACSVGYRSSMSSPARNLPASTWTTTSAHSKASSPLGSTRPTPPRPPR